MNGSSTIPSYWRNNLQHIEESVQHVKRGKSRLLSRSAGGRDIYVVEYGEKSDFGRSANYNSACGAGDTRYYADKKDFERPVILIVGGIHGGELEGVVAVLNLIQALETGVDFRGEAIVDVEHILQSFRLLLIPCMNPDGRARVPVDSVVGMSMEQLRYHVQGAWKDGTLCGWPECKAIHPLLNEVSHLGGYFNDDGVNMMHDQFFMPMAQETKDLMKLVDEEAVDATIQLHGGTNCTNQILNTAYVPYFIKQRQYELAKRVREVSQDKGLSYVVNEINEQDGSAEPPPSFNLTSALHHVSGGMSMTYETNMGLDAPGEQYSYEEILESHYVLFQEMFRFMKNGKQ